MRYVAGYCVCNDVSEREYQIKKGGGQWGKGKGCDTFGPLGPWLVTTDEIRDPQNLPMWLKVNGETRQNGSTSTMIFGVAKLVADVSRYMTLEPGDVVTTGTPPGVGMGMKPTPQYLKAGDTVELGIDGLGDADAEGRRVQGAALGSPDTRRYADSSAHETPALSRLPQLRLIAPEPTGDRMAQRTDSAAPRPPEPLGSLYEEQLKVRPDDPYLQAHAQTNVAEDASRGVRVLRAYLPPRGGSVLDWGCRHAPDACLIRARFGAELRIDGCDVVETGAYSAFHAYAGLHYRVLEDAVRLPYEDASFDAVVASGTLEHVPMDYESLKELYRVLRTNGRLIITYLPNRLSVEEWYKRRIRGEGFHLRLYGLGEVVELLKHAGFCPLVAGYQTHLDLLSARSFRHRILRGVRWILPLHWMTSTLSIIAAKMQTM